MDKTLEVILVAVVLVVAAVILVGLLQGQAGSFGTFANNQTNTASCGISHTQFCNAYSGSGTPAANSRASDIKSDASSNGCDWAGGSAPYGC